MAVTSTIRLRFDGAAVKKGLAEIRKGFSSVAASGFSAFRGMLSPVMKIAALLGPAAIGLSFAKIIKDSSAAASTFENMKGQFELFTGSVKEATDLISELRTIAVESPLELSDISEGARMLLTYGVAAKDVAGEVSKLSEVSAGDGERFKRLAYAWGQINSIGRLMGTELRQLTEAGFNPLEMISKKTGRTMLELKGDMEEGKISIEMVKGALKDATSEGGRFYGLNAKMAQTFSGRVSMMRDAWGRLLVDLGSGMNSGMKVAIDAITANMPRMSQSFTAFGGIIGPAIADSVNGDYARFAAIGTLIGDIIMGGIVAALASGFGSMADKSNSMVNSVVQHMVKNMTGATAEWMKIPTNVGQGMKQNFADQMKIRGVMNQVSSMRNNAQMPSSVPGYRMAGPGESSVFKDSEGKALMLLESINRNLAPSP